MAGPAGSDAYASAPLIAVGETSADTDLGSFTAEAGENEDYEASAWWKFTPDFSGTIRLDYLGNNDSSDMNVYTGGDGSTVPVVLERIRDATFLFFDSPEAAHDVFRVESGVTYYVQYATFDTSSTGPAYNLGVSAPTNYVWLLPDTIEDGYADIQMTPIGFVGGSSYGEVIRLNDGKASYIETPHDTGGTTGMYFTSTLEAAIPDDDDEILSITAVASLNATGSVSAGGNISVVGLRAEDVPLVPTSWNGGAGTVPVNIQAQSGAVFINVQTRYTETDAPGFIPIAAGVVRDGLHFFISPGTHSTTQPYGELGFVGVMFELAPPVAFTVTPPLRQYPRNDGLGASSVARVYPPPQSIQRGLRRGPPAIF